MRPTYKKPGDKPLVLGDSSIRPSRYIIYYTGYFVTKILSTQLNRIWCQLTTKTGLK